jgi:AraC-like DNA-binding protein
MAEGKRTDTTRGRTLRDVLAFVLLGLLFPAAIAASGQEATQGGIASPQRLLDNLKTKTYSGRPIDLDLPNASLRTVIAELEKAGGFRLDLDPAVDDRVTYRIRNIPWDEALATVLADNGLRLELDLAGEGFKVFRGDHVVLAFNKPVRAKFVLFLYSNLYRIAAGVVLLIAVIVGLRLHGRRRARRRLTPKKALLPADAVEPTRKKLLNLLEVEKVYRDEDLTLQTLAGKLAVSPHQLSWIINDVLHVSFSTLVNGYRVEDVKGRLSDPSFDHTSILKAAMEAGFNTKASFNRAFKTHTGMTPSQFKKAASR